MAMKSFSEDAEQNKRPILQVLLRVLSGSVSVLEIGSGIGQHAACFGASLPYLSWQTTDLEHYHPGIQARMERYGLSNVLASGQDQMYW